MSMNKARVAASVVVFGLLVAGQFGCAPMGAASENGFKPPKELTPAEQQQDLENRIKTIQDNPNIPVQSKQMMIAQMRATAASPPPALPPQGAGK